jgi:hypothetical protein
MTGEKLSENYFILGDLGLIEVLSWHLSGGTE